nr:sigma-70 family RNA polymerase sigma factor [Nocardia huaxiensis]
MFGRDESRSAAMVSEDFAARTDPYRRELLAYCYRMLGSVHDAEDLVQETLLRAWRARDSYDAGKASLRTWLYRIATNACLTALEQRGKRPLPAGLGGPPGDDPWSPLLPGTEIPWLQPIPDALISDPAEAVVAQGSLRLALVAAMQHLPARQRAVLVLREALDWPAADIAHTLEMSPAAVNSALQRARKTLSEHGIHEDDVSEAGDRGAVVDRYVEAFRTADLAELEKLLTDDIELEMPPYLNWYRGRTSYLDFLARVFALRGSDWRMLPIGANGQPARAAYNHGPDGYTLHSVQVFTLTGGRISHVTVFQDAEVFETFGLAPQLD